MCLRLADCTHTNETKHRILLTHNFVKADKNQFQGNHFVDIARKCVLLSQQNSDNDKNKYFLPPGTVLDTKLKTPHTKNV